MVETINQTEASKPVALPPEEDDKEEVPLPKRVKKARNAPKRAESPEVRTVDSGQGFKLKSVYAVNHCFRQFIP